MTVKVCHEQDAATYRGLQKVKSWCVTGVLHEMQVKLMDGFYFELIETFQNAQSWRGFKWKFQMSPPHFLPSLLSPSHTILLGVINM